MDTTDLEVSITNAAATINASSPPPPTETTEPAVEYDGLLWRKVPQAHRKSTAAQDSSLIGDRIISAAQLSSTYTQQLEQDIYDEIAAEKAEEERLAMEELEREQQAAMASGNRPNDDPDVIEKEFLEQARFYYAVPNTASVDMVQLPARGLNAGARSRERPLQTAVPRMIPDEPPGGVDAAILDPTMAVEQERRYAERLEVLKLKTSAVKALREGAEFDGEELMFAVDSSAGANSSDDSDGYDEDFEEEWRDDTNEIYSACRAVECNLNDEEAFYRLGRLVENLAEETLTPTEQEMIWNALRWVYRKAEPMHPKHWLTSCSSIMEDKGFESRPSVGNWCYLLSRVARVECFSERRRDKIRRWRDRAVFLVRKRLAILREFGIEQPSWRQIHVSVTSSGSEESSRRLDLPVPTMTLGDTLDALTAHSRPTSVATTTDGNAAMWGSQAYLKKTAGSR
ncbi:Hypothetical protein, putative [Bodo saltans]|uniref:Uncharacterized protein n=1 Tax=Bodo saltans TaxID=75058 RepID=A0A0S4J3F7_BODSA|nr:Hypothetical protein, putative [Bodo saltans]|eukprot:CUG68116.1 Hypothetical protein, putative [Bodo saltans]